MTETTSMSPGPFVKRPDQGLTLDAPAGAVSVRARAEESGGALTAMQSVVPVGQGPPLHVHVAEDEFMYVLEGRLRFQLGQEISEGPAGSFAFIPKGLAHTWMVVGQGPARLLFGFTPASPGMEHFFERSNELTGDKRLANAFSKFATDAGMEVLGPPLAESGPGNGS
jgi:quercetin dioxygenase-like cupin family protein